MPDRGIMFRALMAIGWLIVFLLAAHILTVLVLAIKLTIGMLMDGNTSVEYAYRLGASERIKFYREYGSIAMAIKLLVFGGLLYKGVFPWTTAND